jgi:NADPH:quinone reductase-like Zn-dependent oxidoreductase
MKAAIFEKYGPPEVLQVKDITMPVPGDNEILVKVINCAVTAADCRIRGSNFPKGFTLLARLAFGVFKPRNKILGSCFSGLVTDVGSAVTKFKVGDVVFGMTGMKFGAYAEYIVIDENKTVLKKPVHLSFEDAAALSFGGTTALFFLRDKVKIQKGHKILINGASGAVGTNAVQIAKYYGAVVTGVCSTTNVDFVKTLGADNIIDYTKQDLLSVDDKYDVILDTVGNISIDNGLKLLTEKGVFVVVVGALSDLLSLNKKVVKGTASEKVEDLNFLADLVEQNKLRVVIDKVYSFENIVEAHRYASTGHKRGNVILQIGSLNN